MEVASWGTGSGSLVNGDPCGCGGTSSEDGQQYLDLGGEPGNSIRQVFSVPGSRYRLAWYDNTYFPASTSSPYTLSILDASNQAIVVTNFDAGSPTGAWQSRSVVLDLSAGSYTLVYTEQVPHGGYNSLLDNASLMEQLEIITPPQNQVIPCGSNVTFSVVATNALGGSLAYQWQFNGINIDGATNSAITLTNATTGQAGLYTVLVGSSPAAYPLSASASLAFSFLHLNRYAGVTIDGRVGGGYRVESADSLTPPIQWATLTNILSLPSTPYVFIDFDSVSHPNRFYRVVSDACP